MPCGSVDDTSSTALWCSPSLFNSDSLSRSSWTPPKPTPRTTPSPMIELRCTATPSDASSSSPVEWQAFYGRICRVDYRYPGQAFTAVIPYGESTTFFVDPRITSYRMNQVNFEKGPEATIRRLGVRIGLGIRCAER